MKNRIRIALLTAGLFVATTGTINAYSQSPNVIVVVDDGKVTQYESMDVYVEELLDSQSIMLNAHDEITPSLETALESGMRIVIERHIPEVTISFDGQTESVKTTVATVEEFFLEYGVEVESNLVLNVELDEIITDGLYIEILTRTTKELVLEEEIPFESKTFKIDTLELGLVEVVSEGIAGKKEMVIEEVYLGGQLVEQIILSETIIEAQPEIIHEGTMEIIEEIVEETATLTGDIVFESSSRSSSANTIVCSFSGATYEITDRYVMEATAYTNMPNSKWNNITASGMPTFIGMVAVDRNVIPLGTILYVDGYGLAIAGDTGGAIKGYDIDLFMNSYNEAIIFGRRDVTVYRLADQTLDVQSIRANE